MELLINEKDKEIDKLDNELQIIYKTNHQYE